MKKTSICLLILLIATQIFAQKEEMRGVWIATTKNIDYPSNKHLSVRQQKAEFIKLLNLFSEIGINAVILQIRPAADAFFPSKFEPWSEWLTGKQGKAPKPYYDPLKFMINECHKRNIEFHAWINPFRAVANINTADVIKSHISNRKPNWIFKYDINKYFNPGIPQVQHYLVNIISDIVRRYDIDGVHFDDYFYPYPKKNDDNKIIPIPDTKTFRKYGRKYKSIAEWRRHNLNVFIKTVNDSIKSIKPYMVFGISPSGIWRNKSKDPNGSNTRGFAHYDYLYADVLKWLKNGWIDYVAPQLYWSIGNKYADYTTLVKWWSKHTFGRKLYIGHGIYNVNRKAKDYNWRNPSQLPTQMRIARQTPNVSGDIFYKASSIRHNRLGCIDSLKQDFYTYKANTPSFAWLPKREKIIEPIEPVEEDTTPILTIDTQAPPSPDQIYAEPFGNEIIISWNEPKVSGIHPDDKADYYKIYRIQKGEEEELSDINFVDISNTNYYTIKRKRFALFKKKYKYFITAIDQAGNESSNPQSIELKLKLRN